MSERTETLSVRGRIVEVGTAVEVDGHRGVLVGIGYRDDLVAIDYGDRIGNADTLRVTVLG